MSNKKRKLSARGRRIISAAVIIPAVILGLFTLPRLFHDDPNPTPTPADTAEPTPADTAEPSPSAVPSASPETTDRPVSTDVPLMSIPYSKVGYQPSAADNTTLFESGWAVLTDMADATVDIYYDNAVIMVNYGGDKPESINIHRDGIPYSAGADIYIYFEASSAIDRNISLSAVNADTGEILHRETYALTYQRQGYEFTFTCGKKNVWNGRLQFDIGAPNTDPHSMIIYSPRIVSSAALTTVKTNHIGYTRYMQKRCTFPYDAGDLFDIIDVSTGNIVYSGAIVGGQNDDSTGENNCWGDFTTFNESGEYFIRAQIGVVSPHFVITDDPFNGLREDALNILSLQRCGTDTSWWAGALGHGACHTSPAKIYGSDQTIDVSGGWHDAGDYGRYMKTGAKAVSDLLFAYMYDPDSFTDERGPEAGNGVPDILDEARYELEWMLKMQGPDGGVYNTAMTSSFPGTVDPAEDNGDLVVLFTESTSTADFAGTMAAAAQVFWEFDPDFSHRCYLSSLNAYNWLNSNPEHTNYTNPEDIQGGLYLDDSDLDGRFYTYMALYKRTGDHDYLTLAKELYAQDPSCADGISWTSFGGYGRYLFLTDTRGKDEDPAFYQEMKNSLLREADELIRMSESSGYQTALHNYAWGSNGTIADNGVLLTMAYDVTGIQKYQQTAVEQLNYLLGKNVLDRSFITGYGRQYPHHVHSRLLQSHKTSVNGALVGGPDAYHEDPVTADMPLDTPPALNYADDTESYSTNEITVYWNSALIHLLTRVE